jgi:hypothetical protein
MTLAWLLTDRITIKSLDDLPDIEQIDTRLRTLIQCTEQTIPGSRFFGLPRDYLDAPMEEAINLFGVELQEKSDYYVPEISIESVDATYNLNGQLNMKINIERRDEDDS